MQCLHFQKQKRHNLTFAFRLIMNRHFFLSPTSISFGISSKASPKIATITNTAEMSAATDQKSEDAAYRSILPFEIAFWIVMGMLVIIAGLAILAFVVLGKEKFWS